MPSGANIKAPNTKSKINESKQKQDEIGLTQQEIWEKKYNGKSKV